jgi:hypothetical protein
LRTISGVLVVFLFLAALAGNAVLAASPQQAGFAPVPTPAEVIARLRPEHPRVLLTPTSLAELRDAAATDAATKLWVTSLQAQANSMLAQPPSAYALPDGLRLSAAATVLQRAQTLALAFLLLEEDAYRQRLWEELEAVAQFPDWNPIRHFLDTAAITAAFGIAYDWLYDTWTPEQQRIISTALTEKGLKPGEAVYRRAPEASYWWATSPFNWNFVCSGGLTLGALAVADEQPELAGYIVGEAIRAIPHALATFHPDGGWPESVGYWQYSIQYLVPHLAALETALGTDYGLSTASGLAQTAGFPIHMTGPTNQVFSFADGTTAVPRAPEMFWLATKFGEPFYGQWQSSLIGNMAGARDLLWGRDWASPLPAATNAPLPLDAAFQNIQVATMRSAWNDPQALYVGFKAGDNSAGHANLDLGTFVLDALGVRWAEDLGRDDYNLPGYFSSYGRWNLYRMRAEGHNTLVINPDAQPDQHTMAKARITYHASTPEEAVVIADLTQAYLLAGGTRVERGIALFDQRRQVLVQDEIETYIPSEIWWFMHTKADIQVAADGASAVLSMNNRMLVAQILSPAGARFSVMPAAPLPTSPTVAGQNPNSGYRKLAIYLQDIKETRISVLFTPVWSDHSSLVVPAVRPLEEWTTGISPATSPPALTMAVTPTTTPYQPVSGTVNLGVSLTPDTPVHDAELWLDGMLLHRLCPALHPVNLDTRPLNDGRHLLTIRYRHGATTSIVHFPFYTSNWWRITDPMDAPTATGWFGTISTSETSVESPGWSYDTQGASTAFDSSWRVRTTDSEEYLQFTAPHLRTVEVRIYAPQEDVTSQVRFLASPDDDAWMDIPYSITTDKPEYHGIRSLRLTAELDPDIEAHHFRLVLLPGPIKAADLQVGQVELAGLRD